jgi:predicted lipoprotein with Yx(FWY)xxD motif
MMTRAHLAAVATLGVVAVAAAGCGSSSSGSSSSSAGASSTPSSGPTVVAKSTSLGTILTDGSGRTLYLFGKDSGPKSTCSGACATNWPPFTASSKPSVSGGASSGDVKLVARSDGNKQVVYNGHPLYYFSGDKSAGDMNGQGLNFFGGKWYVLSPAGAQVVGKSSSGSSGGSSTSSGGGKYGGY